MISNSISVITGILFGNCSNLSDPMVSLLRITTDKKGHRYLTNSWWRVMPLDAAVLQQHLLQTPGRESYRGIENNNNGLIDYLSTLGLGDDHISNINCLLLAAQNREVTELEHHPAYSTVRKEEITVSLFFAEEQEILRTTFLASLNDRPGLTLVGSSERISGESLILAALELRPLVLVLGIKGLQPATVEMKLSPKPYRETPKR